MKAAERPPCRSMAVCGRSNFAMVTTPEARALVMHPPLRGRCFLMRLRKAPGVSTCRLQFRGYLSLVPSKPDLPSRPKREATDNRTRTHKPSPNVLSKSRRPA